MEGFKSLESNLIRIYNGIKKKDLTFDDIMAHQKEIYQYMEACITHKDTPCEEGLYSVLMMALDQYTYSNDGSVVMTDREYDLLHEIYHIEYGKLVLYPDVFESKWKIVKNTAPWMVGNIKKAYKIKEIEEFIKDTADAQYRDTTQMCWIIAPKFDGISACLQFYDHKLVQATTRGTRAEGQDITQMVSRCANIKLLQSKYETGYLKVELCVPRRFFPDMQREGYANRRSATAAVVNTPKNINFAQYVDAVPLLWYSNMDGVPTVKYEPMNSEIVSHYSDEEIIDAMHELLKKVKDSSYEYRVDGVILYPIVDFNPNDVMATAIAFKINTAQANTHIKRVYLSIGRTGHAVPMIEVEPCEVNETIVTDVSLGSINIFNYLKLHQNEEVIIYSAGDVIPQMKLPNHRSYEYGAPLLELDMECPYCGGRIVSDRCQNPNCPRIVTGKITNFIEKTKVIENISDSTVSDLYNARLIHEIPDIFDLKVTDIENLNGYTEYSAGQIVNQIEKLRKTPIRESVFLGALGIPGVGEKIASVLLSYVGLNPIVNMSNEEHLMLMNIDGIGTARADVIYDYILKNSAMIKKLMNIMNLVPDPIFYGTVVFTGFRDTSWEVKFDQIGLRIGSSVTKDTILCICANPNTTKAKSAARKGIPIFMSYNIQDAYNYAKRYIEEEKESDVDVDD